MKRKSPRSGDLKDQIEIYTYTTEPDGYGGVISTPVLYWATMAEVKPMRSSNRLEVNQDVLKQVYRIMIRFRPDKQVGKLMKVIWRGKELAFQTLIADLTDQEYVTFDAITAYESEEPVTAPIAVYFGSVTAIPITLDGLLSSPYGLPIEFETGTVNTHFVVAVKVGMGIESITDLDTIVGGDVTDLYEPTGISIDGYSLRVYEIALPYSVSHTHKIVLEII